MLCRTHSTFLATSALLVMFGLLGYAFGQGGGGCPPRAIGGGTCAASAELLTVRVVLLATDFAAVFFSFSMGVRYLNHTSYIINAGSLHGRPVSPELVIAFHRRAYRRARARGLCIVPCVSCLHVCRTVLAFIWVRSLHAGT